VHGQRPLFEEREQERSHADVIGDHLFLGDAGCGVQHLVEPGEAHPGEVADARAGGAARSACHGRVVAGAGQKAFRPYIKRRFCEEIFPDYRIVLFRAVLSLGFPSTQKRVTMVPENERLGLSVEKWAL
jgi:hypothetical protein